MTPSATPVDSFAHTERAFTRWLRAPGSAAPPPGVAPDRMALYRELVFGNMERMLANLFPVLRRISAEQAWHALVDDFLRDHTCHAGLFTRLPQEFAAYVSAARSDSGDPPFLAELVHYEALDYAVTIDVRDIDDTEVEPEVDLLDGVPLLNPLAHLLSYTYPVQRISPDYLPTTPPAQPTYLAVCRDREDRVGFIELNPVAARLIALVAEGGERTGLTLLDDIARELGHPQPDVVIAGGTEILNRLQARDVLLGARRPRAGVVTGGAEPAG